MIHNFSPLKSLQRLTVSHQLKARPSCVFPANGSRPVQLLPSFPQFLPLLPRAVHCWPPQPPPAGAVLHPDRHQLPPLFQQFSCTQVPSSPSTCLYPGALLRIYPVPSSHTKYSSLGRLCALSRTQDFYGSSRV